MTKQMILQSLTGSRPRLVWRALIVWAVVSMIGLAAALASMAIDRSGTTQAGAANLYALWPYWIASASLWLALTGMWLVLRRQSNDAVAAGAKSFFRDAAFIMLIAIAVRGVVLATHDPALSDDVYRYLFEGRTFAAGFNPYAIKAQEREAAATPNWPGESQLLPIMTYHELATPYLPVSQLVFGGIGLIIGDRWTDPISSARVFRVVITLIELVFIVLLFGVMRHVARSPWWVALYAWHPLPIGEFAGSGHQDVVGMALMGGAMLCFASNPRRTWRWAALLGLACAVKPVAALAGVFMLCGRRFSEWVTAIVIGSIVMVVLIAPFWVLPASGSRGFANWCGTVQALGEKWAHFAGVYEPVLFVIRKINPAGNQPAGFNLVQERQARAVCLAALALTIAVLFLRQARHMRANRRSAGAAADGVVISIAGNTAAALLAFVLLSTTAHPWYLLWSFALLPLARSPALWVLSLTITWGYVVFATGKAMAGGEEWTVSPRVIAAAYLPVWIVLAWQGVIQLRNSIVQKSK